MLQNSRLFAVWTSVVSRTRSLRRSGPVPWTLTIFCCLLAAPRAIGSTNLEFRLEPGDVFAYEFKYNEDRAFEGFSIQISQEATVTVTALEPCSDGHRIVSMHFPHFEASMVRNGRFVRDYRPEIDLEDQTIVVHVSSHGDVAEIVPKGRIVKEGQNSWLADVLRVFFAPFPKGPIEDPGNWHIDISRQSTRDSESSVTGSVEFMFDGFKDKRGHRVARIKGKSAFDISVDDGDVVIQGDAEGELEIFATVSSGIITESKYRLLTSGRRVPKKGPGIGVDIERDQLFECRLVKE